MIDAKGKITVAAVVFASVVVDVSRHREREDEKYFIILLLFLVGRGERDDIYETATLLTLRIFMIDANGKLQLPRWHLLLLMFLGIMM